ncbi:MAG: Ig-like domain repeat protein [Clostridia bacterium]|nr:Ig-like domain repeat protein [Clostridia bacterium]
MKKIKSIWARLLVVVLSVAMMFGCMGGIVLADGEDVVSTDGVALHAVGKIPSKIELGDSFTVPAANADVTVTVKKPNGEIVTAQDGEYTAANLGNYTVTYAGADVSYTYTINCYEDTEYFIYVENNGATIRDIVKAGTSFELPAWYLAYTDEDGNLVKVDDEDVVSGWKLNNTAGTGNTVSFAGQGSYTVSLWAGFDEDKTYSEEFTVVAQTSFNDEKAPTIRNIANMPSSASVKTKVSLPVATAEDDYDENVLVSVSVTGPNGAVKEVEVNDHGYATKQLENEVAFDNDRVTSFYPWDEGTYVVTYKATDDAGNASAEHTYKITVSDKTGPVIVDVEDDKIPTVWGLNSVIGAEEDEQELAIEIPIPEVIDNKDAFVLNAEENAWSGNITMKVEIANPEVTVAKWDSVTAAQIGDSSSQLKYNATYPAGSIYNKYFKADVEGVKIYVNEDEVPVLRINFSDFSTDSLDGNVKAGITGNWTITFSFRDGNSNGGSNNSQKVYTINVTENTFEDAEAPVIEEPALPAYIIVGGSNDVYTVPAIAVSDDNDSRLTEAYELVSGEDALAVEGGEELAIVEEDGIYFFENEDGERLELGASISLRYEATDDVGNTATLLNGEDLYTIDVYTAATELDASKIDLSGIVDATLAAGTGDKQYLGGFAVNGISQREFVGFELSVKDEDGNALDNVSAYVYFAEVAGATNLYVKNISFNPAKSGNYELNIRILDAVGNSYAYSKIFVAEKANAGEVMGQANATVTSWAATGTTRTPYMLQRKEFVVEGSASDYARVFKISGRSFSLLGYEFTPLAQGSYQIGEFYGKIADLGTGDSASFENALTKVANYGMTVTDEETASFEVVGGSLPTYLAKTKKPANTNKYEDGAFYVTEPIYAYSESRNYNVSLSYTDPNGNQLVAKKVYESVVDGETVYSFKEAEGEFYGRFALILDKDGTYNVTARATDASGSNSKSFTIKVGDIEAVQFELSTTKETKTVGDAFSFRTFTVTTEDLGGDSASNVTVTYRLIEPGNTEVSSVSGSAKLNKLDSTDAGVYTIKLDSEYKFQKSGDYTVEITLTDDAGNKSVQKYTISVSTTTSTTPASLTMLSTILIIVGILLIAGVIFYLIRFRKHTA